MVDDVQLHGVAEQLGVSGPARFAQRIAIRVGGVQRSGGVKLRQRLARVDEQERAGGRAGRDREHRPVLVQGLWERAGFPKAPAWKVSMR